MHFPGQKFRPSAARENEIDRLLRDARAGSGSFARRGRHEMPMGHMLAKNTTGAAVSYTSVVMYHGNAGFETTQGAPTNRREWDMRHDYLILKSPTDLVSDPVFPDQATGGLAVALEPILDNEFGRVAIAGLALVGFAPGATNRRYLQPDPNGDALWSYWGFGRALTWAGSGVCVVDLSDRAFLAAYQLTTDMTAGSATATLGLNGPRTWTTTVHDIHGFGPFQKVGNKGLAEWSGQQWCVKVAYC